MYSWETSKKVCPAGWHPPSKTEWATITVSATMEQLLEGEKRLYKFYGVRVSGKQSLSDGKPSDLNLLNYIEYNSGQLGPYYVS